MALSPAAKIDIGDTFGAMLTGAFITTTIYGITTLQAYFYYLSFPRDNAATKLLVAAIWALDTVHVIFMCHAVHYYLVDGFVNPSILPNGIWSLFMATALNILMAFIVQGFFTHRIFLLCSPCKRYWVGGTIALTVLLHFAFGIRTVVNLFVKKKFVLLKDLSVTAVVPFGITTIVSDVLIAAALCLLLHRNRSDYGNTNSLINRLIVFAINRCILTSAVAIVETVAFAVIPNTFYSFAIDFIIGKLYANSLLAVLNARANLRTPEREHFTSTEMATRFKVATGAENHSSNLLDIRTRDSGANVSDSEKGGVEKPNIISTISSSTGQDIISEQAV